ncbi:RecA protein [Mycoplasmopsis meleagridis]|uniref:Protein RecA n=1 Tax=Mycoplasmopsis meleagridis ATCC 25294 TaxID=1264554 RepID=A0A0F5H1I7_9BACT|nr:recombinase RecA [Mycoplasmopsis meleagridis]KKB27043.1 RecA protein [Mycoplasmopsis meleagridis ATCC 25294]KUH47245.1 DNA recombination/repair protein RecA [Mycoplasmopsis meleagridis]OAD18436.1 RecA protein [Mycoplasmopsis meleagridis]VEU77348.1 recombinase protein, RecA [Mycoplasmopsis meleagridis]
MNKIEKKQIDEALKEISKKFGDEAIRILGEENLDEHIETFSSGSYLLDNAIGIGGYPKGRIIEIFGPESSGKTTLCLHAISEVQKLGGICAFIDAEHSMDPIYAKNLGVKLDELIISQPDSGEQALEIVDILAKSGSIDLIVVDSVAALVPEAELNGDMHDMTIGSQARLMSKALRKITASLNKNKTTVIFVNQIREKIGVIFGNPETTAGGRALKFYSSIRLEVRKSTSIVEGKDITGNEIKVKVVKNKVSAPYKSFTTQIIFGKGIDALNELIDMATELNIFNKKGTWYYYEDKNIAQGKKALKDLLSQNLEFKKEIENLVNKKIGN